jgi:hypothetical protein
VVIRRIAGVLGRMQKPIVRGVQRVLLHGLLFLLYFVGFGLSRLLMMVLARRTLYDRPAGDPGWRPAEDYDLDELRLRRQS